MKVLSLPPASTYLLRKSRITENFQKMFIIEWNIFHGHIYTLKHHICEIENLEKLSFVAQYLLYLNDSGRLFLFLLVFFFSFWTRVFLLCDFIHGSAIFYIPHFRPRDLWPTHDVNSRPNPLCEQIFCFQLKKHISVDTSQ